MTNNCAVVGSKTIACDLRFLWQLRRAAIVLTLSSIKKPGTEQYYFDRVELRNKFLAGEGLDPTTEQAITNLNGLNRFLALELVKPSLKDFNRIQNGFVRFVLAHEVGHIVKKHAAGAGFIPCAEGTAHALQGAFRQACDVGGSSENEADDFALSVLSEGVAPEKYTPERAIPELFIEQHERRIFRSLMLCGLDPAATSLNTLPADAGHCFEETLYRLTVTETHPTHLRRYVRFMKLLQERNVKLTVSLQTVELAEQFSAKVRAWCDAP
ncbi:hypothetical protein D7Y23_08010 [Corallococcus sp. AB050B]|nr:hypothetical protein D7Y23_08010 [Corallococcus sp. AB050B]